MRDTKQEILSFWFGETKPKQWFEKNESFDAIIFERFEPTYHMAKQGLCDRWAVDAHGCLALCIVLDQFPRNMYRGQALAFDTDEKALIIARQAIHKGYDQVLQPIKRRFLYLPFEHSERMSDQKRSVELFATMKEDDPIGYEHAVKHHEVIERFGRFPHRNKALGRETTPEEQRWLDEGGGF